MRERTVPETAIIKESVMQRNMQFFAKSGENRFTLLRALTDDNLRMRDSAIKNKTQLSKMLNWVVVFCYSTCVAA